MVVSMPYFLCLVNENGNINNHIPIFYDKTFLFWGNYKFICSCKKYLNTLHPVFSHSDIIHKCNITARKQTLIQSLHLILMSPFLNALLCLCITYMCRFMWPSRSRYRAGPTPQGLGGTLLLLNPSFPSLPLFLGNH
jgi:hypothetical protein